MSMLILLHLAQGLTDTAGAHTDILAAPSPGPSGPVYGPAVPVGPDIQPVDISVKGAATLFFTFVVPILGLVAAGAVIAQARKGEIAKALLIGGCLLLGVVIAIFSFASPAVGGWIVDQLLGK